MAHPATPANPEPTAKVIISQAAVLTPRLAAMGRFCIAALIFRPCLVRYMRNPMSAQHTTARPKMKRRLQDMENMPKIWMFLSRNDGQDTLTLAGPKTDRTNCCSTRLIPQVTRRLSSALPYSLHMITRSNRTPSSAVNRKDTRIAAGKYQSNIASGKICFHIFWTT